MHDGYPTSVTTYGLYCDRCGSFNLGRRFTLTTWAQVLAVLIALGSVVTLMASCPEGLPCVTAVLLFSLFLSLTLLGDWFKYSHLRCKQCGNRQITREDVLNYSDRSWRSIVDVPDQKIVTYEVSD